MRLYSEVIDAAVSQVFHEEGPGEPADYSHSLLEPKDGSGFVYVVGYCIVPGRATRFRIWPGLQQDVDGERQILFVDRQHAPKLTTQLLNASPSASGSVEADGRWVLEQESAKLEGMNEADLRELFQVFILAVRTARPVVH